MGLEVLAVGSVSQKSFPHLQKRGSLWSLPSFDASFGHCLKAEHAFLDPAAVEHPWYPVLFSLGMVAPYRALPAAVPKPDLCTLWILGEKRFLAEAAPK